MSVEGQEEGRTEGKKEGRKQLSQVAHCLCNIFTVSFETRGKSIR